MIARRSVLRVLALFGAVAASAGCAGSGSELCDPAECSGCCLPLGGCVEQKEQSNLACGTGGAACASCVASAACTPEGTCAARSRCGGCTTPDGACLATADQTAERCGSGGAACVACAQGEPCVDGRCGRQCTPIDSARPIAPGGQRLDGRDCA